MGERLIRLPEPRRSWLMHCVDTNGELGVCEVTAESGDVVVHGPDGDHFRLEGHEIAQFQAFLAEAVAVAEVDLAQMSPGRTRPVS